MFHKVADLCFKCDGKRVVMAKIYKIIYTFSICLYFFSIFSKSAEAFGKNPDDVAKLQKFVDAQLKKGTKLPKYDVTWDNTHYEWDGNGNSVY